jgi:hypothetical protein
VKFREQTIKIFVRCEVFTAVTMKIAVFWDVAPCRHCVNRRFGGTYRLHLQGRNLVFLPRHILYLLWPATCWPTSPDPSPLLSTDFPCSSPPLSSCSYTVGFILNISLLAPTHAGSSLEYFLFSSTLKMEAIRSSETSFNTISTRRHIQEGCFLQ